MKKLKKVLLLGLTFAMSATLFAACGGKGGDGGSGLGGNITGEQLSDKAAFLQALEDTGADTNATVQLAMKSEEKMGEYFEKEEGNGTVQVADGKIYEYLTIKESWNVPPDEELDTPKGEKTENKEGYYVAVDGDMARFEKVEGQWTPEFSYEYSYVETTVAYVLRDYAEIDLEFVAERCDGFVYANGAYTFMTSEDFGTDSLELKFTNGKLAYGKMFGNYEREYDGQKMSYNYEIVFTVTYGKTTIALPWEEDEEPEDGNSSELGGSSEGGEVGGGAVADEAAWNAALSPSGDYLYKQSENGVELVRYEIDGDTVHILQEDLDKYYTIEEGKYYFYEKVEDQAWTKTEITQDIYNQYVGYVRMDWAMMFPYSEFTYDEASDTYKAESIFAGITLSNVAIKIADGKLAEMTYTMEGITCTLRYTYQDVTLTLPEIDNVGD